MDSLRWSISGLTYARKCKKYTETSTASVCTESYSTKWRGWIRFSLTISWVLTGTQQANDCWQPQRNLSTLFKLNMRFQMCRDLQTASLNSTTGSLNRGSVLAWIRTHWTWTLIQSHYGQNQMDTRLATNKTHHCILQLSTSTQAQVWGLAGLISCRHSLQMKVTTGKVFASVQTPRQKRLSCLVRMDWGNNVTHRHCCTATLPL